MTDDRTLGESVTNEHMTPPVIIAAIGDAAVIKTESYEESVSTITQYLNEIGKIRLLMPEEELLLGFRIQNGDRAAWSRLVEANLRLVVEVSKRYIGQALPQQDLMQEGNIGLMRAADRFDPTRGYRFSTYAVWWIRQEMTHALNEQGRTIRIPENISKPLRRMHRVEQRLTGELGGEAPTPEQVADAMGISVEALLDLQARGYRMLSLEAPINDDSDLALRDVLEDRTRPTLEQLAETAETREEVARALSHLTERQRMVVRLRFGFDDAEPMNNVQIGRILGITKEGVRQILIGAMSKLHTLLTEREDERATGQAKE